MCILQVRSKVIKFVLEVIRPAGAEYKKQRAELVAKFGSLEAPQPPILDELREKAKAAGLYNFFLPEVGQIGVLEYAPIAEILGAFPLANIAMNCSAPDTGNMEVLEKYGTPEQKEEWLKPLLEGKIRSAFAMTEPGVASSDATNITSTIEADGDDYVVNGHKWYISGAIRPECKVFIFLGRNRFDGPIHNQQSMIIIPRDAPGVKILRGLGVVSVHSCTCTPCTPFSLARPFHVHALFTCTPFHVHFALICTRLSMQFGHIHDHAEIIFDNVRVPKTNMILGEGRGFEIAQGRLGPGRIHHCMRTIGVAEMALAAIIHRAYNREAFGGALYKKDTIRKSIAEARIEITKCRQLCYLAAVIADERGFKEARKYVSMIKVAAPECALKILDEAMQIHGAHGVSQDSRLSDLYTGIRTLRIADGPDIVQLNTVTKVELAENSANSFGKSISGVNKNIEKYGMFEKIRAKRAALGVNTSTISPIQGKARM
jgi:acyl-CoA dehydrogenase